MDSGVILTLWIAAAIVIGGGGYLVWYVRDQDGSLLSHGGGDATGGEALVVKEYEVLDPATGLAWTMLVYSDGAFQSADAVGKPRRKGE